MNKTLINPNSLLVILHTLAEPKSQRFNQIIATKNRIYQHVADFIDGAPLRHLDRMGDVAHPPRGFLKH
jgi:hypothetical protein